MLKIEEKSILLTGLLLAGFLTAAALFPLMEWLGNKIGFRNGFILTESIWIIAMIPFAFLDGKPYVAMICMVFVGIGLSGAMYFVDIIMGQIIDEDEINSGHRRQGSYYGVNALINRYSTILVFLAIAIVLTGYGWDNYIVAADIETEANLAIGLKILMVPVAIGGLIFVILGLLKYDLHGEKLKRVQEQIEEIRKTQ